MLRELTTEELEQKFSAWLKRHRGEDHLVETDCCKQRLPDERTQMVALTAITDVAILSSGEIGVGWMTVYQVICDDCKHKYRHRNNHIPVEPEEARRFLAAFNGEPHDAPPADGERGDGPGPPP